MSSYVCCTRDHEMSSVRHMRWWFWWGRIHHSHMCVCVLEALPLYIFYITSSINILWYFPNLWIENNKRYRESDSFYRQIHMNPHLQVFDQWETKYTHIYYSIAARVNSKESLEVSRTCNGITRRVTDAETILLFMAYGCEYLTRRMVMWA